MAAAPKEAASGAEVKAPATPHRKKHEKTLVVQTVKPGQPLGIQAPPIPQESSDRILDLVELAIKKGSGPDLVETVKQLVAVRNQQEDRAAAKEFFEAFTRAKARFPVIVRNRDGKNISQERGTSFAYKYADLHEVGHKVNAPLAAEGFIYYWTTIVDEGYVTKYCHLRHVNGHEEVSPCRVPTASKGGMSEQQKISAAGTFAMRLSLIDVLGLTTADPDLDGQQRAEYQTITAEQATDLQALYEEVKAEVDVAKLFAWLGVSSFAEVPSSRYSAVVRELEKRRGAR